MLFLHLFPLELAQLYTVVGLIALYAEGKIAFITVAHVVTFVHDYRQVALNSRAVRNVGHDVQSRLQ